MQLGMHGEHVRFASPGTHTSIPFYRFYRRPNISRISFVLLATWNIVLESDSMTKESANSVLKFILLRLRPIPGLFKSMENKRNQRFYPRTGERWYRKMKLEKQTKDEWKKSKVNGANRKQIPSNLRSRVFVGKIYNGNEKVACNIFNSIPDEAVEMRNCQNISAKTQTPVSLAIHAHTYSTPVCRMQITKFC